MRLAKLHMIYNLRLDSVDKSISEHILSIEYSSGNMTSLVYAQS